LPLLTLETNRSKKSTEYQSNLSPREAKTDDSKLDLSVDRDRLIELEFEITHLKEYNENLATENYSLRSILKDYEETKTNEDYLLEQLDKASIKQEELEYQIDKSKIESSQSLKTISELNEEIKRLKRKNKQMENEVEMRTSHLETKVRLLEEALNKRNDDIKEIELSNEELIVLLEK
jgi:chromosome segregation ATPase